jgi:hypothetical protein
MVLNSVLHEELLNCAHSLILSREYLYTSGRELNIPEGVPDALGSKTSRKPSIETLSLKSEDRNYRHWRKKWSLPNNWRFGSTNGALPSMCKETRPRFRIQTNSICQDSTAKTTIIKEKPSMCIT